MKKIIIDTDIDTDCDDVGALGVLHNLATAGKAKLLGINCSIPLHACAQTVSHINRWYKRPDIPVGLIDEALWANREPWITYCSHRTTMGEKGTLYNEILNEELATALVYPGSLHFYRSLLYQQPDNSVTICGIGTLTALAQLVNSPADSICSLSGEELIKQHVTQLVCMASVNYPHGRDGFNLRMDIPSSYRVITDWPTPVAFQASGSKVMTGSHSMRTLEEHHPLRRAYEIWLQDPAANRCSWDQLTVLYAVLGTMDLFSEMTGKGLQYNPNDGVNSWVDSPSRFPRTLVQIDIDPDQAASIVEDWMIGSD